MAMLRVLLGISGGIAAYKGVEVLRGLQREGAEVRVAMTAAAQKFVQPLTFEALSGNRVYTELFPEAGDPEVIHVRLGEWPHLILIAPATANVIGKMANGLADDLLTCTVLSSEAPVMVAPAMETAMYRHPASQRNLQRLADMGYRLIGPEEGALASGSSGMGRLADPQRIVAEAVSSAVTFGDLSGRRIVVTGGRTEEDIDPVRFITNRSTGKMGYAVARRARQRGADVVLVSGPGNLDPPAGVDLIRVRTVSEMRAATESSFEGSDALVMTAAVLDFRPRVVSDAKIKKNANGMTLDLVPNDDFLVGLGARKHGRIVVGFAMETENGLANAQKKRVEKYLDLIVLNNLNESGAGFGVDTNVVTLIDGGEVEPLPKMSKLEVADRILDWVKDRWT
ncbi:MAG: bifunctional phosphopantothenoylcysteine decarboxylase/phosphopantothenate--cysteine ligase CoaBC [Candidatus Latescibacteria bacterium]|nr:bifunctional phosphopantothenoylcysteine decarboxylase/phosphopantothenate--cysteine ligase CoaBC [Candidatus Latescibacterota bacterium]